MELLKYFLIICFIFGFVESFQLNCIFQLYDVNQCKVEILKVIEADVAVTLVSGDYTTEIKTNDDVMAFWITKIVETERVPTKVCNFFPNLDEFHVEGKSVKRISREAFTNCKKVSWVSLRFTSLVTLPEDLFMDLFELRNVHISENEKLVSLPAYLFLQNPKIKTLRVIKNKQLLFIDTELPLTFAKVEFHGNACVDKSFPYDIANLDIFITEIKKINSKCLSKAIALNKSLCEEEIKELKGKKNSLESENVAMATRITNLLSTIESLKVTMTEKETQIRKLSQKNDEIHANLIKSIENNKLLQENLAKIITNHQQAIEKMESAHRSKLIPLNKTILAKEEENAKLKQKKETCESEKVVLAKNITQQMTTIENLKIEIDELKMNSSQELTKFLEENNVLKSNNSNLMISLTEITTNISKLEEQLGNCNQNNTILQTNLKANETNVNKSLEECLKDLSVFNELSEETAIIKKKKENLEFENVSLSTNITQLMTAIENLKNINAELETDCAGNGMENSAELLKCLDESKSLKSNYENLFKTLTDLTKPSAS